MSIKNNKFLPATGAVLSLATFSVAHAEKSASALQPAAEGLTPANIQACGDALLAQKYLIGTVVTVNARTNKIISIDGVSPSGVKTPADVGEKDGTVRCARFGEDSDIRFTETIGFRYTRGSALESSGYGNDTLKKDPKTFPPTYQADGTSHVYGENIAYKVANYYPKGDSVPLGSIAIEITDRTTTLTSSTAKEDRVSDQTHETKETRRVAEFDTAGQQLTGGSWTTARLKSLVPAVRGFIAKAKQRKAPQPQ